MFAGVMSHRITYLLLDTRLFGGVKSTLEQADRLAGRGHDVRVLTFTDPPDWISVDVPIEKVDVFDARTVPESDFVVGTYWPTVRPALECRRGIPLHYCRGYEGHAVEPGSTRARQIRDAYELPAFKLVNARHTQRMIQSEFRGRAWYVPNAIDVEAFHPADIPRKGGPLRILLVGPSSFEKKGVAHGLRAVQRLKERGVDVELIRVSQSAADGLDTVDGMVDHWLGRVPPEVMPEIYRSVDLLLGTSVDETEGFFLPAVEAMASGVVTVLSDVPCHHAYAEGTTHAVFVPPADPDAMAREVARLAGDPDRRHDLARAGRAVAGRFGWDPHLDRLEAVLDEIREEAAPGVVRPASVSVAVPESVPLGIVEPTALTPVSQMDPDRARSVDAVITESQYAFAAQMVASLRVVDVGCGRGDGAKLLAEAGATSVLAVDRSEVSLAYARRSNPAPGVTYRAMDACRLDLRPGEADLVVAFDVLAELGDPEAFLAEAHRVLGPRGALLLSVPNSRATGNDGLDPGLRSDHLAVVDDLRRAIETRFGRVVCFGQSVEGDQVAIRPEMLDGRRDVGFLVMGLQPQREPTAPEANARERTVRRRAA